MRGFVAGIIVGVFISGACAVAQDEIDKDVREVIAAATKAGIKVYNPTISSVAIRNAYGATDQLRVAYDPAGVMVMAVAFDPDGKASALKVDHDGRVLCSSEVAP